MRGHHELLVLRAAGFTPDWVFIDTDPDVLKNWSDWHSNHAANAALLVEDKDNRPDLRCVVGLKCMVQGEDRKRVFAIRDACIKVGAKRVIASVTIARFSEFRTVEVTDTAGIENYVEADHG